MSLFARVQLFNRAHPRVVASMLVAAVLVITLGPWLWRTVFGATYTWDGGGATNDWSECANWSSNTCPGASDIAQFNSTSVKDATVDPAHVGSVAGVAVNAGYTGVVTQNRNLTIGSSNFTMASGTWAQGTTTFNTDNGSFTLSGGTFHAGAGTSTIDRNFTISGGTYNASSTRGIHFDEDNLGDVSTLTCSGTFPSLIQVTKTIYNSDNFTLSSGCTATSTTISMLASITIDGTLNMQAAITTHTNFTVGASGSINANNNLVLFADISNSHTSTLTCTGNFSPQISVTKDDYSSNFFTIASGCNATSTTLAIISSLTVNGALSLTQNITVNRDFTIATSAALYPNGYRLTISDAGSLQSTIVNCAGVLPILFSVVKSSNSNTFTLGSGCVASTTSFVTNGGAGETTINGTLNLTQNISMDRNLTIGAGGIFNGGTSTVTFDEDGGSDSTTLTCTGIFNGNIAVDKDGNSTDFILGSGCTATSTSFVIDAGGGNATINGTLNLASNMTIERNFTLATSGVINGNGYSMLIGDNAGSDSTTLTCTGTFPITFSVLKDSSFNTFTLDTGCTATSTSLVLDGGGGAATINGTLNLSGNITAQQNFTVGPAGTINPHGYSLLITSSAASDSTTLTCTGILPIVFSVSKSGNSNAFTLASGCTATSSGITTSSGAGTVSINSSLGMTGNINLTTAITVSTSSRLALNGHTLTTSSTFTLNGILNMIGTESVTAPTNGDSSVIELSGTGSYSSLPFSDFESLSFTQSGIYTIAGAITVEDDLTVTGGATFTHSGTVTKDGSGVITTNPTTDFTHLTFSGYAGTTTLAGSGLDLAGTLTIASGTLDVSTSGCSGSSCSIEVAGGWSNSGTFVSRSGAVTLNGTNQTVSGNTTFTNISKVSVGNTLTFSAGSTQTVTGLLQLMGGEGSTLALRSSAPGSYWNINPQGTRQISNLDVQDSNNLDGTAVTCDPCGDSGHNLNWDIVAPSPRQIFRLLDGVRFIGGVRLGGQ